MERPTLPKMDVSSWWLQAVVLTFLFGFAILGYLAIRIYQESPPVPDRIVSRTSDRISPPTTCIDWRSKCAARMAILLRPVSACVRNSVRIATIPQPMS